MLKQMKKSQMILLPLSIHDETSTKGAGVVLFESLFEIALLICTFENDCSLHVDIGNKLIFLTGHALSMSNSH